MNKQYLYTKIALKENSDDFEVIASTGAVDRQGEVVDQAGWDLGHYKNNPVILWAHDYSLLPIGRATNVEVTDKGLVIAGTFASAEANPMAQQVKQLYQEGILSAVSVGFMAKERNGSTITKSELLELSFVPVPANPEALSLLAVRKGLDQRIIDDVAKNEEQDAIAIENNNEPVATVTPDEFDAPLEDKEKAGRVVSSANRKLLQQCADTLKTSLSVLEQVLSADDGKAVDVENTEEKTDTLPVEMVSDITEKIKNLQNVLRINDKTQEIVLSSINEFIKTHSK